MSVYLDNSATTRVCDEAIEKMADVMRNHYGNPSSLHAMGVDAEDIFREARAALAEALHCAPGEVLFTSGGTESNNLAVLGGARALRRRGKRIVTSAVEHASVLAAFKELESEGFEAVYLEPGPDGAVREDDLKAAVTPDTVLVSMMLVNNETGAVQPVEAARRAVQAAGSPALIHCDAVQAFCKIPLRPEALGVDLLSVSSHKIHGPKGAGALYLRRGARILPILYGGGQQNGLRPGTEPMPAIAGFGVAAGLASAALARDAARMEALRGMAERALLEIPGVALNGADSPRRAPHILNFSVPGVRSETMLHFLESMGVFVSSGSACSRGARSHVLRAMGLPDARVDSSLRVSLSRFSTEDDIRALAQAVAQGAKTLCRAARPAR